MLISHVSQESPVQVSYCHGYGLRGNWAVERASCSLEISKVPLHVLSSEPEQCQRSRLPGMGIRRGHEQVEEREDRHLKKASEKLCVK